MTADASKHERAHNVTADERAAIANGALQELARRLVIACDVIAVHRDDVGLAGGRGRKWTSLRYGAFLLAYAPFEAFFDNLTDYRATKRRTLGIAPDKVRNACQKTLGIPNVTKSWRARTRVWPTSPGSRSRWETLEGARLKDYLLDMKSLRDLLSHGADPKNVTNKAGTLWPIKGGRFSMRLMGVEGFIWAVEDIATCTGLAIAEDQLVVPKWPRPVQSGISATGRPPNPYQV
jgi:hypothetical protein